MYWYLAQAFLGAMKRGRGRAEDGEEQGKRGIVRRNSTPTIRPVDGYHNRSVSTGGGSRWLNTNYTQAGILRLSVDSRPPHSAQMAAERLPNKFIGAVEDEWQLYRSTLSPLRLRSLVPVLTPS